MIRPESSVRRQPDVAPPPPARGQAASLVHRSPREHCALTLRHWSTNLAARSAEAIGLIGAERERVWRLYMPAAALAFDHGELSVQQFLAAAPGAPNGLPLARAPVPPTSAQSGRTLVTAGGVPS